MLLEICASSVQSARNAQAAGADRIELCQSLEVGGLTPSYGLVKLVKDVLHIPVHVLIRPRAGDFVYTDDEMNVMLADISFCHGLGCEGVVIGVLNEDHQVHIPRMKQLVEAARPMQVTFHRAFDDCTDLFQAVEDAYATGCSRILTTGGTQSAAIGIERIAALVERAGQRITIMPGGGISAANIQGIAKHTNAVEYHASASSTAVQPRRKHCSKFDHKIMETDLINARALVHAIQNLHTMSGVRQ